MESMLYQAHRFLGGIKHFRCPRDCGKWTSFWKTLHVKNGRKYDQSEDFHEVWSIFKSQWSVASWIWITKPFMTFWTRNWACGQLVAASQLCSLSHCHLCERSFDQKRVFQWFRSPHTHLSSSFSWNSHSTSEVIILELWTTSKRLWQTS
jgi:hypothetical protein